MKKILLISAIAGFIVLNACNDSDDPVNPLVKTWKLDVISIVIEEPGFESNNLVDQDVTISYTMELRNDLTYTRTRGEGETAEVENGNWEEDGDFIELDPEAGTAKDVNTFIFYDFTVSSVTERELDIAFEDNVFYIPDATIDTWISDGTLVLNEAQTGYVFNSELTQQEIIALQNEAAVEVTEAWDLNFDAIN